MKKYVFVDCRIREVEESFFKQIGYNIIKLPKSNNVYDEISSHTDIFVNKIENNLIIEKEMYMSLVNRSDEFNCFIKENEKEKKYKILITDFNISEKYPNDVALNACSIGKSVIHNFKYTDKNLLDIIDGLNYKKININQGYSKCSIAIINDNNCIVGDLKIKEILEKNMINTLFVENVDKNIKLFKKDKFSKMHGFIGGSIAKIGNNIIVFGDLEFIDVEGKIRKFINIQGKKLIEFKNIPVIDYGGIVII